MKELTQLQEMGYQFSVEQDRVHYNCVDKNVQSSPEIHRLLESLRQHRELVKWLLSRPPRAEKAYVAICMDEHGGISWSNDGICSHYSLDIGQIEALLADASMTKVFYDAVADVVVLEKLGFQVRNYTSVKEMHQVSTYDAQREGSLLSLSSELLGCSWREGSDQCKDVLEKSVLDLYHLCHLLEQQIEERYLERVWHREEACLPAIVKLQQYGIQFNFAGWNVELDRYEKEQQALLQTIQEECQCPELDVQSPGQLQMALWKQGAQVAYVSEKNLEPYAGRILLVDYVLKYKKLQKKLNSFGTRLQQHIDTDGRMRGKWHLIGANTGRMSCTKPNLQGMPRKAKRYFKAAPGAVYVIGDYSQIELRVIAHMSQDKNMMSNFINREDLHVKTAAAILGKCESEVTEEERQIAKAANFGLIYGMTSGGLQKRVQKAYGFELSWAQAEAFRNGFFSLYPGILRFQDRILRSNEVRTVGGRCWSSKTVQLPLGSAARLNYPIQGTATEGFKEALSLLFSKMAPTWKLVAVVHDEVVLEVPESEAAQAITVLKETMIEGMARLITSVPIEVDIRVQKQWGSEKP